jgi:hypothetical protein
LASIDFAGDIDRIIAILQNNTTLNDAMRDIRFGESNYLKYDESAPNILVTVPNSPFKTRDSFGVGEGSTDPQHSVQYLIKIIVDSKDSENAERELYGFIKQVTDIIRANPRLKDPVLSNDPKCIRSFLFDVPMDAGKRGHERIIATVGLQCQVGSEFTLDIAGFTAIPLISKPIERETESTENIYDTARIRKAMSPISEIHSFFAEIEYIEAHVSALRTQKRNRAVISTTLNRPSGSTAYSGKLTEISNGASYDQLETVTILFEVIH